jgi:hypothetical protein
MGRSNKLDFYTKTHVTVPDTIYTRTGCMVLDDADRALLHQFNECDAISPESVPSSSSVAVLALPDGQTIDLPILHGALGMGPSVIDVRSLFGKTGASNIVLYADAC